MKLTLKELELKHKKHEHKLEELARGARSMNLIVYNLPEDLKTIDNLADKCFDAIPDAAVPDDTVVQFNIAKVERLGRLSADHTKPEPVRVVYAGFSYKHEFLRYSKCFRAARLRIDNDVTRKQQEERDELAPGPDFKA